MTKYFVMDSDEKYCTFYKECLDIELLGNNFLTEEQICELTGESSVYHSARVYKDDAITALAISLKEQLLKLPKSKRIKLSHDDDEIESIRYHLDDKLKEISNGTIGYNFNNNVHRILSPAKENYTAKAKYTMAEFINIKLNKQFPYFNIVHRNRKGSQITLMQIAKLAKFKLNDLIEDSNLEAQCNKKAVVTIRAQWKEANGKKQET